MQLFDGSLLTRSSLLQKYLLYVVAIGTRKGEVGSGWLGLGAGLGVGMTRKDVL